MLIGATTYDESNRFERLIYWLDWFVTVFFLIEIIIRLMSEKRLINFFKKGWNVFDFIIVLASLVPMNYADLVLLARRWVFRVLLIHGAE